MPFDNLVVQIRLTGRQLRQVFAAHLQRSRRIIGFSGIRVRAQCSAGSLDVVLLRPSGVPIRDDEPLLVAISDFLATGGDGMLASVTPPGGFPISATAPLARDVLADYLSRLGGRLREEALLDAGTSAIVRSGRAADELSGPLNPEFTCVKTSPVASTFRWKSRRPRHPSA